VDEKYWFTIAFFSAPAFKYSTHVDGSINGKDLINRFLRHIYKFSISNRH